MDKILIQACSWCKRIKVGEEWVFWPSILEAFLQENVVTSCLCPECKVKEFEKIRPTEKPKHESAGCC
jgi:hypothetical protein